MIDKRTDSSYNHSHKKSAKSFVKAPCKVLDIKRRIGQNSQLRSFLCPNKTNTAKFSHIKKYVLQIGTIHQKQSLIRGFQRGVPFGSAGKRGGHRGRENPALNGVFSPPKRGD